MIIHVQNWVLKTCGRMYSRPYNLLHHSFSYLNDQFWQYINFLLKTKSTFIQTIFISHFVDSFQGFKDCFDILSLLGCLLYVICVTYHNDVRFFVGPFYHSIYFAVYKFFKNSKIDDVMSSNNVLWRFKIP